MDGTRYLLKYSLFSNQINAINGAKPAEIKLKLAALLVAFSLAGLGPGFGNDMPVLAIVMAVSSVGSSVHVLVVKTALTQDHHQKGIF